MGILSSILYRFIKQNPIPTETYPSVKKQFYYSKLSTSRRIRLQRIAEATATGNNVTYDDETFVIVRAEQVFRGKFDDINVIVLSFDLEEDMVLEFYMNIPLTSKEILPGSYKYGDENKENYMAGTLILSTSNEEEKEEIDMSWCKIDVHPLPNGDLQITGECICENKKKLTIQYEGPFHYEIEDTEPNGKGWFRYGEEEYPLTTATEEYQGVWSEYVTDVNNLADYILDRWSDHIRIELEFEERTEEFFYVFSINFAQQEGHKILPGIYTCTPNKFSPSKYMPMNSCTVAVAIFPNSEEDEEDEDSGDTLVILEGQVEVIRDEEMIIKGEGKLLEDNKPFSFYYKGKPEWKNADY